MGRDAFYLKADKGTRRAMDNLRRWMNVAYLAGGDCYILCDREDVAEKIRELPACTEGVTFIKSDRESEEAVSIIRDIIPEGGMANAGYAHLTTFLHARERSCGFYWNIDADDTQVCLSADRTVQLLECAASYAREDGLDCFSLDMHTSRTGGRHWSFGVTYIKNRGDWPDILRSHGKDRGYLEKEWKERFNIDCYFTYLRSLEELKIRTFCFKNLKFIHHNFGDAFENLLLWGIMHWKDGEFRLPMLEALSAENSKRGHFPIPGEVVRLEIGIEDREAEAETDALLRGNWKAHLETVDFACFVPEKILEARRREYKRRYNLEGPVACWGYGECFKKVFPLIERICPVAYVCDSDERKWGKAPEGCEVISPEDLPGRHVSFVLITVVYAGMVREIKERLESYGIASYCEAGEWVEGFF